MTICSSCGNESEEFSEGVCVPCCKTAQAEIDDHYDKHAHWAGLTDKQRDNAIEIELWA